MTDESNQDEPKPENKQAEEPKLDNLPPEDIYGPGSDPDKAFPDPSETKEDTPPDSGSDAEEQQAAGQTQTDQADQTDGAPKLDNLPPEDVFGSGTSETPQSNNMPAENIKSPPADTFLDPSAGSDTPAPFADAPAPFADQGAGTASVEKDPSQEPPTPVATPTPFLASGGEEGERVIIGKAQTFDLTIANPSLNDIIVAAGWEQAAIEEDKIDIDLSIFFLDRNDNTRQDEDFIFYNNPEFADGKIKHLGDNRTGAGEGDDEAIFISLKDVPFDVLKVVFVLSIYDEEFRGHTLNMVRDVFLRVVDKAQDREICCYKIPDEDLNNKANAMYVGEMYREGAKWLFDTRLETETGGLAKIATYHDLVIREMQTVDLNVEDENSKL